MTRSASTAGVSWCLNFALDYFQMSIASVNILLIRYFRSRSVSGLGALGQTVSFVPSSLGPVGRLFAFVALRSRCLLCPCHGFPSLVCFILFSALALTFLAARFAFA